MSIDKNIIAYCTIQHNSVVKNGEVLFGSKAENLQSFLLEVYQHFELNYPKFYKMDNLSKLGWLASELLLNDIALDEIAPEQMSIVLQNANASLDTDIKYYDTVNEIASPALFVYTLPNIVIGEISIRNKFKGENAFFVSDTFDAALTAQYVNSILDNKKATHCICGWVDVFDESYKTVLYLVSAKGNGMPFTAATLDNIYNRNNV